MWNNNNGIVTWELNKESFFVGQWNNGIDFNQWGGVLMKLIIKDFFNFWVGGG